MFEFVISTDIHHFWLGELRKRLPVSVVILDMISNEDGIIHYLVDVKLDAISVDLLLDSVNGIEGVDVVNSSGFSKDRVILTVCVDSCDICQTILCSGCFLDVAWTTNDRIIWTFLSPKKEYIQKIANSLDHLNIRYDLKKIQALGDKEVLTKVQEEVLRFAFERGYYDFPKKIGILEIGKEMGVSNATVSEILRRGTKNLISRYLVKHE